MAKSKNYINSKGEEIDFVVEVFTRPNLRGSMGEMIMYQGRHILQKMFDECAVDASITSFHMEYPERWANLLELRAIPQRMIMCFPNLKEATIRTHSVYIIQCVEREHILIFDNSAKEKFQEKNYSDLKTRYCELPDEFVGLWMATPEKIKQIY